jgi:hypothetical protein
MEGAQHTAIDERRQAGPNDASLGGMARGRVAGCANPGKSSQIADVVASTSCRLHYGNFFNVTRPRPMPQA